MGGVRSIGFLSYIVGGELFPELDQISMVMD